jgi:hypothetical protein
VHEQPLKPKWQKRHERFQPARVPVTTAYGWAFNGALTVEPLA